MDAAGEDKPWSRPGDFDAERGAGPRRFKDRPARPERRRDDLPGEAGRSRDMPVHGEETAGRSHRDTHRRDHRREGGRPRRGGHYERRDAAFEEGGEVWIWGSHAAGAVLANPKRRISRALVTHNSAQRAGLDPEALPAFVELLEPGAMDERLPGGAVHQGIAVRCAPLDWLDIADAAAATDKALVILDQVTDPQNVGAVFRSAAAFGIGGVVMQTRNAPALGGALAKAAAGAIEQVDEIRAVNLSRAIDTLRDAGWRVIGLDGSAEQTLDEAFAGDEPLAIVLGAEGAGIRQGVAKACTGMARIAIGEAMESLNVSNAAAIAFYEAARRGGAAPKPPKASTLPARYEDADGTETD